MINKRRWLDQVSNAISGYTSAERSVQFDLLDERAGLIRTYDPINDNLRSARNNLANLKRIELGANSQRALSELVARTELQEQQVERFNSDNALLQNSLAFLGSGGTLESTSQELFNRILKLTLDTTQISVGQAEAELKQTSLGSAGAPSARFLFHARVLVDVLPEMDRLLVSMRNLQIEAQINALQAAVQSENEARSRNIFFLQIVLGVAITLWLASTISLLLTLRANYRDLQIQAANERLSAAIAVPLINSARATFPSRVREAAERLAIHVGARRLQLLVPGIGGPIQFSKAHDPIESNWLSRFVEAADADGAWEGDRVLVSLSNDSARGAIKKAMRAAEITKLVLLRSTEPLQVILGFEPENFNVAQRRDHLAGLSSAIIAVGHGALREIEEHERERLEQALAHKTRVEKIGAIASGVAHNFNNIIGAISGFAEMGQDCTEKGSRARKNFVEIEKAAERARHVIDDILNFAKQRRASKAPHDMSEILSRCMRMLSAASRKKVSFELCAPNRPIFVRCVENDLQQALLNICNNAADAGAGEPVHIRLRREQLTAKMQLSHGNLLPGNYLILSVTDSGPGISIELLDRLFEPFVTTKRDGTGLGLSTAWDIVQGHGGTIHVENNVKGGATFSVWLPELCSSAQDERFGNGARILLLTEAERLPAEEEMLAELGYEPLGFAVDQERDWSAASVYDADAVLISTWQSWRVEEIIRNIGQSLSKRPLLVATSEPMTGLFPAPARILSYPIRPDEVSAVLSQALTA
jgi:signal transduction histidine kinase